jgi:hypothetical protein
VKTLGLEEAFARFGAKPVNRVWACSAYASDGALVISGWGHLYRQTAPGVLAYVDNLSRAGASNKAGSDLLRQHLETALREDPPVRMVVATAAGRPGVARPAYATKAKKTFHVRKDLVGKVVSFDGDNFVIEFRKTDADPES